MGFISDLFGYSKEVQDLVNWICEHDTYEYLGNPGRGYCADEYYYNYSVDSLKHIKEQMMQEHAKYEYDKKHTKPKIGDVYSVYLCGKHVDTLRNVTNVSHNENGVFFTITLEDGTTRLKSYFGSGNIHWCKEG